VESPEGGRTLLDGLYTRSLQVVPAGVRNFVDDKLKRSFQVMDEWEADNEAVGCGR